MTQTVFKIAATLIALCIAALVRAEPVPMTADRWDAAGLTEFAQRDGRAAVRLGPASGAPMKTGALSLKNVDFTTGTIEFDMLASGARDFAGVIFRADDAGNGEFFYIRPHMNARPDAAQYTPLVHGSMAWQIFGEYNFERNFPIGKWMHVRVDVYPSSATVKIDGLEPIRIPHLKSANRTGAIGLNAVAGTWFANMNVTPIADHRDPQPAAPDPPLAAGTVAHWQVSPALADADAKGRAEKRDWVGVTWKPVATESNGIANLSLGGPRGEGKSSYVARFTVTSATAANRAMRFGFSDKAQVYLNGRLLYAGEDLQASRDYRFLGTVGFWDALYLQLEKGPNEVSFVVSDTTNGGTAAAARFEDPAGLTIG